MDKKLIDIPVPHKKMQQSRLHAMQRITKQRKKEKLKVAFFSVTLAAVIVLFSVISTQSSTNHVSSFKNNIPGISSILPIIEDDQALIDIVKNEYFESINKTVTKNGIEVNLVGVMADEKNLLVFFTAEREDVKKALKATNFDVLKNGEWTNATISFGWDAGDDGIVQDVIYLSSEQPIHYENEQFELRLSFQNDTETEFNIPFTVQNPMLQTKVFNVNQALLFDNQKIWVDRVEVSPIHSRITLKIDEENDMQLLQIGEISLRDEQGNEWGRPSTSMLGLGSIKNGEFIYFAESKYFRMPEKLFLTIGEVQALPKGKDRFIINERYEIEQAEHLTKWNMSVQDNEIVIEQKKTDDIRGGAINEYIDANGVTYFTSSEFHMTGSNGDDYFELRNTFPKHNVAYPLTAMIYSYPNNIGEEQTIELK